MNNFKIGAVILTAQILIFALGVKTVIDARREGTDPVLGYVYITLALLIGAGTYFQRIGDKLNDF